MKSRCGTWLWDNWLTLLLLVAQITIGIYLLNNIHDVRKGVCTLRRDRAQMIPSAQEDLQRAQRFLKRHPHGVGIFSRADVVAAIAEQEANLVVQVQTVQALSVIHCADVLPPAQKGGKK